MIENKKYYATIKWRFLLSVVAGSIIILFIVPFDYGTSSFAVFSDFDWIATILIVTFNIVEIIGLIQTKRKKAYIYINDGRFYIRTMFGKKQSVSLSNEYDSKESKGKLKFIVIKDDNNKPEILLGGIYEIPLEEVEKLLETYKTEKSTL